MTAFAFHYTVQRGDTLSAIAGAHYPGRIYGKNGSLQQILSLNPIKNPDIIYPGQVLRLSQDDHHAIAKKIESKLDEKEVNQEDLKENKNPQVGFVPFSSLSVLPKLKYQRVSATDTTNGTTAKVYSSESYGVDLDWQLHWSEKFASTVGLRYSNMKYQQVSNRAFTNKSVSTTGIKLGLQYKISTRALAYTSLEFGSHTYLYAPTTTSLRIDKGHAFSNTTGVKYTLVDLDPLSFGLFGGIGVLAPTDVDTYKAKAGYSGHVGIELAHTLKTGNRLKAVFEIEHGARDTKPVNQKIDNMSLGIGMEWRFE